MTEDEILKYAEELAGLKIKTKIMEQMMAEYTAQYDEAVKVLDFYAYADEDDGGKKALAFLEVYGINPVDEAVAESKEPKKRTYEERVALAKKALDMKKERG